MIESDPRGRSYNLILEEMKFQFAYYSLVHDRVYFLGMEVFYTSSCIKHINRISTEYYMTARRRPNEMRLRDFYPDIEWTRSFSNRDRRLVWMDLLETLKSSVRYV